MKTHETNLTRIHSLNLTIFSEDGEWTERFEIRTDSDVDSDEVNQKLTNYWDNGGEQDPDPAGLVKQVCEAQGWSWEYAPCDLNVYLTMD